MRTTSTALALFGATLMACGEAPDHTLTGPGRPAFDVLSLTSDEAAILADAGITVLQPHDGDEGTTGGIQYLLPPRGLVVAWSALRHQNGLMTGEAEWVPTPPSVNNIHMNVVCLTVNGNRATFAGVPQGRREGGPYLIFFVTDNGQGGDALPDQITIFNTAAFPLPPELFPSGELPEPSAACDVVGTPGGATPVTAGNLQVRDAP